MALFLLHRASDPDSHIRTEGWQRKAGDLAELQELPGRIDEGDCRATRPRPRKHRSRNLHVKQAKKSLCMQCHAPARGGHGLRIPTFIHKINGLPEY
jgi:hypothetical protein